MRIGILTFHAAHNYGAVLQCYALQTYLKELGHEVEVIDYRQRSLLRVYQVYDWRRFISVHPLKCLRKFVRECRLLPLRRKRYAVFDEFICQYLHLAPVATITSHPYDVILVGSDQVWNTALTNGYDPYYWGVFPKPPHTRLVSYAASMEDNPSDEKCCQMHPLLRNFYQVSVREQALATRLSKMCNIPVASVVDPTLLLDSSVWERMVGQPVLSKDYVLLYEVHSSEKAEHIARQVADELGIEVVMLASLFEANKTKFSIEASPLTFINLFKYARFVVASSFHGTVFALQFARPFVSVKANNGKDGRVANLLSQLHLEDHFVDELTPFQLQHALNVSTPYNLRTREHQDSEAFIHRILHI